MSRTSTPPTSTLPEFASQKRGMSEAHVDLPPPEGPTSASVLPAGISKLTWSTAGTSAPSYVKLTSSKHTPFPDGCLGAAETARGLASIMPLMRANESALICEASPTNMSLVIAVGTTAEKIE